MAVLEPGRAVELRRRAHARIGYVLRRVLDGLTGALVFACLAAVVSGHPPQAVVAGLAALLLVGLRVE